jgi:RND family efflux transporter MFP subunit
LIEQLRIERPAPVARSHSVVWWSVGAIAAAALLAAAAFVLVPRGVPIRVARAEVAPEDSPVEAASILDASGYVVARRQATVSAKITGKVVMVAIEEGQHVERDEVIARLDDSNARATLAQTRAQLEQSKANLIAAEVAFANAEPTFRRNEQQLARAVISAQAFDTAKASYDAVRTSLAVAARAVEITEANLALAERNLDDTIVRAPFAGIVTVKAAQEGEMVSPISAGGGFTRTGIGTIVDMGSLEVEVDVSESFINRVEPEQPVTVKLNAYPDWSIAARVIAIIPTADRAKATVKVRVALDAGDPRILPEMGARVAFLPRDTSSQRSATTSVTRERPLLVPRGAVLANGDTGVIFVVADDSVERRTVRLGAQTGASQLVLSGLAAGTRVALGDLSLLADNVRVRIVE